MDKGGIKAAKIIEILKNARLQDCTPSLANELLAVPRDIANVIASNGSEAKGGLTNIEAAIELLQKLGWRIPSCKIRMVTLQICSVCLETA